MFTNLHSYCILWNKVRVLALEAMDTEKLQKHMVYLKAFLASESCAKFAIDIIRRLYSLIASLASAEDQELLIFINKQVLHFVKVEYSLY